MPLFIIIIIFFFYNLAGTVFGGNCFVKTLDLSFIVIIIQIVNLKGKYNYFRWILFLKILFPVNLGLQIRYFNVQGDAHGVCMEARRL